jgi:hypothetical protein
LLKTTAAIATMNVIPMAATVNKTHKGKLAVISFGNSDDGIDEAENEIYSGS